uniref:Uncharacterized protein n=1 Tax=Hyaloperonospora arabidopsidis (strain Emoy2) TaxID=559515 RepID=M4BVN0_HYAAE
MLCLKRLLLEAFMSAHARYRARFFIKGRHLYNSEHPIALTCKAFCATYFGFARVACTRRVS